MRVGLTGHRPERLRGKELSVALWIDKMLEILKYNQEKLIAICGGCVGADQIFGERAVISADVKLWLYLPCKNYRAKSKEFKYLLDSAEEIVSFGEVSSYLSNTIRDRRLALESDILLAIWDGKPEGGVYETIQVAKQAGIPIIYFPWEEC